MNRRSEPRQAISLRALVHPREGRSWMCVIRDFCHGGMLLTSDAGQPTLGQVGARPRRDDPVYIHFSIPMENGPRHHRVLAKVARVLEDGTGIGVFFPSGLEEPALNGLTRVVDGAGSGVGGRHDDQPDARIKPEVAARLREQLRRMMERALPRVARAFLERADKDLLIKARDASSSVTQNGLFEAMSLLERKRRQIEEAFQREVLNKIDKVEDPETVLDRRKRAGETQQLSLVDTERFEEWLAVAEVISKAEARSSQILGEIRLRMSLLAKPWAHKEVNPVSPAVLVRCMSEALSALELHKDARREIYRSLQEAMLPLLRNLYSSINKTLEESGAFPPLEELEGKPQPAPVRKPVGSPNDTQRGIPPTMQASAAAEGALPTGGDWAAATIAGYAPGAPQPAGRPAFPGGPPLGAPGGHAQGPYRGPPMQPGAPGAAGIDGAAFNSTMPAHGYAGAAHGERGAPAMGWGAGAYQTARQLLDLSRMATASPHHAAAEVAPEGSAPFSADELVAGLTAIQRRGAVSGSPLRLQLLEQMRKRPGAETRGLSAGDRDAMQVVENLVSSVVQDSMVTDGVKEWVRNLELTLTKLATVDTSFLNSSAQNPHPAVEVLNQLAKLGAVRDEGEGIDRDVGRSVDELMERLVRDFDQSPEVFNKVLQDLYPLVERQTRAYRGNFERTVRQSEGQQKLINARRSVLNELEQRVSDQAVPELLVELLNPGWRNLLVHAHLRHGEDSAEWKQHLGVVDRLLAALGGGQRLDTEQSQQLLGDVRAGLEGISYDPARREPLLDQLGAVLQGRSKAPLTTRRIQPSSAAETLGLESAVPEQDPTPEKSDSNSVAQWRKSLAQARHLQVGDWVALTDEKGKPRILTLAFIGEDHASFALVNRKGIKVKDLTLRQMTSAINDGLLQVLDEFDLPLMERATNRMMQNMHNQLAYLAAHDELTGLLNRREFEKRLEKLILSAAAEEHRHVLVLADLDQFKVVNSTSGHTAGDEQLKAVANSLKHALRGTRYTLARMGGDEFGVLLERTSDEEGRDAAQRLLDAIRGIRFEWETRLFTLTASLGMVAIDAESGDATNALKAADAACYAAKEAGRNRLQVFARSDVGIARRSGAMEWAVQIDKAIAEDRLMLNSQPIVPIRPDDPEGVHYEILLTMRDEDGRIVAPGEFIAAAEAYNRMTQVDRWVVAASLKWMSEHRNELDHVGGFSINISGHSINDESFADYVLRQFSNSRVPTGKVCFEVTETAAISNLSNAVGFINRMKLIGCKFSLDDFGTGLSSYSYLRNLPVDYIKIDGVFVKDLHNNPGDYAVVKSINEIAHFMGKRTIAEYVQAPEILEQLQEIGVDFAQGYSVGRPAPMSEFRHQA